MVIPKPKKTEYRKENFILNKNTTINCREGTDCIAEYLSDFLDLNLKTKERSDNSNNSINLRLLDDHSLEGGGYELEVTSDCINIFANANQGIFYGTQSLLQLLPVTVFGSEKPDSYEVPGVKITDIPAFPWRGLHLDVARHYMPVDFIKKFIDLLAMHKMNILHWHLTEDQGWRIEIKKYPELTKVGAWRKETIKGHVRDAKKSGNFEYDGIPHGGFYTQEEIKDIVGYAADRFITIVPEIDMPGHMQAAIAAYPELGCTEEKLEVKCEWGVCKNILNPENSTVEFMKDILTEVIELFPSKFIHIGGDEVPKGQWESNERYQQLLKERGLKDMHEMQSWFIRQIDSFLADKGRRLIGWDEILEGGLADGAAVMSWRGEKGGVEAAKMGHDVVMANQKFTYFDHYQGPEKSEPLAIGGNLLLEKVYEFNPIPAELNAEETKYILGGQGQLWTEYIKTPEQVEYMAFPRATALAEVLWSGDAKEEYEKFIKRLKIQIGRFEEIGVNYRKLD